MIKSTLGGQPTEYVSFFSYPCYIKAKIVHIIL